MSVPATSHRPCTNSLAHRRSGGICPGSWCFGGRPCFCDSFLCGYSVVIRPKITGEEEEDSRQELVRVRGHFSSEVHEGAINTVVEGPFAGSDGRRVPENGQSNSIFLQMRALKRERELESLIPVAVYPRHGLGELKTNSMLDDVIGNTAQRFHADRQIE